MNIQELCKIRKEELKLTYHDISDASGVPLSTVQNFFSKMSKAPSIYTVAPICKVLGISLDEVFGISERLTRQRKPCKRATMSWNATWMQKQT